MLSWPLPHHWAPPSAPLPSPPLPMLTFRQQQSDRTLMTTSRRKCCLQTSKKRRKGDQQPLCKLQFRSTCHAHTEPFYHRPLFTVLSWDSLWHSVLVGVMQWPNVLDSLTHKNLSFNSRIDIPSLLLGHWWSVFGQVDELARAPGSALTR